ncbi:MAG: DUF2306 domain-containing protein [Calditrichota bacterium]
MLRLVKYLYFPIAVLFAIGIIIKSVEYLSPDFTRGYLSDKAEHFHWFRYALYAHMTAAPIAFFCGLFQFISLKSRYHKLAGRIYVFTILFFAAPSGLAMSFLAIGGLPSVLTFLALSICWFIYTFQAYQSARRKDFGAHARFMVGSYILTNSAILLRIFGYINNNWQLMPGPEGYVVISILSWLPGLLIYELFFASRLTLQR